MPYFVHITIVLLHESMLRNLRRKMFQWLFVYGSVLRKKWFLLSWVVIKVETLLVTPRESLLYRFMCLDVVVHYCRFILYYSLTWVVKILIIAQLEHWCPSLSYFLVRSILINPMRLLSSRQSLIRLHSVLLLCVHSL